MDVEIVIQDPSKLQATINSLRPVQKGDDVPREVLCYVHHEVPVLDSVDKLSPSLGVRPQKPDSLREELTRPFTGLVLLAVSSERTRLSIAMFPTEVNHLAVGGTHKFAFFSNSLVKFLAATKNSAVVLKLQADVFKVIVQTEMANGGGKHIIQGSCPYVADSDTEDGRAMFQKIPLEKGVRITGEEMVHSLKLIDPQLVTLALHSHIQGGVQQQAFTVSCCTQATGDMQFVITYSVKGGEQAVVDVRDVAAVKESLQAPLEGVDEDLEKLKDEAAQDDKVSAAAADFGETLMQNAREYLGIILKTTEGAKKVRFDSKLGSIVLNKSYKLHAHGLLQSKQLISLLTDHARNLEQGLTILMGHEHTTSFIVLAMPLAGNGLVLHAVACSLAEEDL